MSSIAVHTVDEPEMDIMDEADMFLDSDRSSLEYITTTDYEDFASSSIGGLAIGQFDGAMTDEEMDDDDPPEEEKGESGTNLNTHGSASSVISEGIIQMAVEVAMEETYEKCSGGGDHSNCWPQECIMGAPGPSTAPRDVLLSQSASTYNEDLRKALNLSKKHMDRASIEKEEMERAFKMSLLDSSKPKTEEEQIELAIKTSLRDIFTKEPPDQAAASEGQTAPELKTWTPKSDMDA